MLNPMNTTQPDTVSPIAYPIRMEGGDLAPKGKGTFTVGMMPDGRASLSVTLFSKGGTPELLDLIVLDRLELVSTRSSLYKGKQWIKPAAAVLIGSIGFPVSAVLMWVWLDPPIYWYQFAPLFFVGGIFGSGFYAGSKLNRVVRCLAVTSDGGHCIAEIPEVAYYYIQGIRDALNAKKRE